MYAYLYLHTFIMVEKIWIESTTLSIVDVYKSEYLRNKL